MIIYSLCKQIGIRNYIDQCVFHISDEVAGNSIEIAEDCVAFQDLYNAVDLVRDL